ncbi:MAG: phosphoribosylformylglycinamidine synthase subunit PurS [Candidatus Thermoplasmatota archaeon]|nr:phosphoribosylformylglycinamidine synthase subunit PurS [Candidatus Thermoplasmatota archaeon]
MALYTARIEIRLKKGTADPEGKNTEKALNLLGIKAQNVKSVKLFEMDISSKTKKDAYDVAEEACERLLANPVTHNYRITIKE